jgi:hypothetical protein
MCSCGRYNTTLTFNIVGDQLVELDEIIHLEPVLTAGITGVLVYGGEITIQNDDLPQVSIGDAAMNEGNAGLTNMNFPITCSAPNGMSADAAVYGGNITLYFATSSGTATSPTDYSHVYGGMTFTAAECAAGTTKQGAVPIVGNTMIQPDKLFTVNLLQGNARATFGRATAQGRIINDDTPTNVPVGSLGLLAGMVALLGGIGAWARRRRA